MLILGLSPLTAIGGALALIVFGLCFVTTHRVPKLSLKGKKVLLTGGSQGIGLELAKELIRRGAYVCIAARRREVLLEACEVIRKECKAGAEVPPERAVTFVTMDVSDEASVAEAVAAAQSWSKTLLNSNTTLDIVICNAGFSYPARFLDIPPKMGQQMFQVNYFGCVNVARAILPAMYERKAGRLIFVSSMAGQAPVAGFSMYGATKAALRATAASLDMESASKGVRVQIINPNDTKTPGFETENQVKSPECAQICAMGGNAPVAPEVMARESINGVENYSFQVNCGFEGWLLGTGTAGMDPPSSVPQLMIEVALSGVLRLVSTVYGKLHYGICRQVYRKEQKEGKN